MIFQKHLSLSITMVVLAIVVAFSSCVSDQDERLYDDVALVSASFGTMRLLSADGQSVNSYTPSSYTYPLYIDQINNLVYNADSLPVGTVAEKCLLSLAFRNGAWGAWESLQRRDSLVLYQVTDTIDFSQDRYLRVLSSDGNHSRRYKFSVNIHKEYADSFTWTKLADANEIAAMSSVKALCMYSNEDDEDKLFVMGKTTSGMKLVVSNDGATWKDALEEYNANHPSTPITLADDASVAIYSHKIWVLTTANGEMYSSANGKDWEIVNYTSADLKAIIGGCEVYYFEDNVLKKCQEFYGVNAENRVLVATENSMIFVADGTEDPSGQLLPLADKDYNFIVQDLKTAYDISRVTIFGTQSADNQPVVWNKICDPNEMQNWYYVNNSWQNVNVLPKMDCLSATSYADGMIVIGGNPTNNVLYYSPDQGATWTQKKGMHVPAEFNCTAQAAVVSDTYDAYIYLIAGGTGEVWKGKKNSVLWEKK